jgi:peptidoglycan hydrolase-like protein with peptidoglycan-binding domain
MRDSAQHGRLNRDVHRRSPAAPLGIEPGTARPWRRVGLVLTMGLLMGLLLPAVIAAAAPVSAGTPAAASGTAPPWPGTADFHFGDHSRFIKQFQDQMHTRGFFPVGTGYYGPNTLAVVKRLQSLNGLIPNGEIGPNTWRLAWTGTYTTTLPCASQRSSSCNVTGYVNPFAASSWIPERTDQGTDWGAIRPQPVVAIGDAVITYSNSQQQGWPAGKFLVYRLTNGSHAGLYIYVAENLTNLLPVGNTVKAGQPVATALPGGPDIEMGYAAPPGTGPNVATPYNGAPDGTQTPGGKAFARFLIELGAHPQQDPGPGPDRP